MQLVCDAYGETKFYWDGEFYIRLNKNGEDVGRIKPEHLPDPYKLWKRRAQIAGKPMQSDPRLKPQDSTFMLWEHKHANGL